MAKPLRYLHQRANEDWLIGFDSHQFHQLSQQFFADFTQQTSQGTPPKILLAESNPIRFLAAFLAAVAANCAVFLGNPNWGKQEWQQVLNLAQPNLILGQTPMSEAPCPMPEAPCPMPEAPCPIFIPTGGSSGKLRFAIHTWDTLMASVWGFHQYFDKKPVNSVCVLPLYHVSGLMQFLRSLTTGGRLTILPFKALVAGEGQHLDPSQFFISLVPTQLVRLLDSGAAAWLSRFRAVLLGGAPAWESLLERARGDRIPLALTYGMTETASQVVTLKPDDFLRGNNSSGRVLPHARVTIRNETGEICDRDRIGTITIEADSLALSYYDEAQNPIFNIFQTDDLGYCDRQGYLHVIGRRSRKIITGGENVFPEEVEAAIRATQLVADVAVLGIRDRYWGQAVTAIYIPRSPEVSPAKLQAAIAGNLSQFKCPKHWLAVEQLPRNPQGKVNYSQLEGIAIAFLKDV
jgi:O-succinylbenzoic acid--CoA ligase